MESALVLTSGVGKAAYEPPALVDLGEVFELTLTDFSGCYWNKQLGGTDGFTFMGIAMPISNCSS